MARPHKQTVDYFSHDADASEGRTLSILFNKFGHEGISCWWQLLERISRTKNHVISLRNGEDIEYLAAKLKFQSERLKEILSKLAELGAIDKELFDSGLIWSQNFVDRLEQVYRTRKQELPLRPVIDTQNPVIGQRNCIICGENIIDCRSDAKYCSDKCRQKAHRLTDMSRISVTDGKVNSLETELSGMETKLTVEETELSTPETPQTILKDTILKDTILPDFIDKETWKSYLKSRKKPTDHAIVLLLKKLEEFRNAGDDPNEILKRSIMNGWTGIFPLDKKGGGNGVNRGHFEEAKGNKPYTRPPAFRP